MCAPSLENSCRDRSRFDPKTCSLVYDAVKFQGGVVPSRRFKRKRGATPDPEMPDLLQLHRANSPARVGMQQLSNCDQHTEHVSPDIGDYPLKMRKTIVGAHCAACSTGAASTLNTCNSIPLRRDSLNLLVRGGKTQTGSSSDAWAVLELMSPVRDLQGPRGFVLSVPDTVTLWLISWTLMDSKSTRRYGTVQIP